MKKGPLAVHESCAHTNEDLRNQVRNIVFACGAKSLGREDLSKHIKSKLSVNIYDTAIFGK